MEANPITQLGKYHLLRHLARGGMSDIYLAQEDGHEELYALKLVRPEWAANYQHFRRETAILSALKHEHILPLYDFCTEDEGLAYYVTPYIAQGSLKERLKHSPLSLEEAGCILSQIGHALQFIHELGLIHRDIKPANILLDETNHVWLADFGLAKEANTPSDLTDSSCLLGTPLYIAPELLEKQASSSSDIYALGVVLYEMLTGAVPFNGQTPLVICWKHAYELPPLPSMLNPTIPVAVEGVILRALEKSPAARFASVQEMVEAYHEALLEPTVVLPAKDFSARTIAPETARQALAPMGSRWPHLAALLQRRQNRSLAVAMLTLMMLFVLGMTTFAVIYQMQPSATVKVSAQMISLPTARPTGSQATHVPTVTPKPKPAAQTNAASSSGGNSHNTYPPYKHQKHKKKHGRD